MKKYIILPMILFLFFLSSCATFSVDPARPDMGRIIRREGVKVFIAYNRTTATYTGEDTAIFYIEIDNKSDTTVEFPWASGVKLVRGNYTYEAKARSFDKGEADEVYPGQERRAYYYIVARYENIYKILNDEFILYVDLYSNIFSKLGIRDIELKNYPIKFYRVK